MHEFLVGLHERFGEVASFWFGTQYCVSVASARLFKEVQVLFDRPGKDTQDFKKIFCIWGL